MPRGIPDSKLIKPEGIIGSDSFPSEVEITEDVKMPLGELVVIAFTTAQVTAEEWNKLSGEERDKIINGVLEKLKAEASVTEPASGISLAHKMKEAGYTYCYKPNVIGQTVTCGGVAVGPEGIFSIGENDILEPFINELGLLQRITL